MALEWTAHGGWRIEHIVLDQWPCWKVTRHGYLIADCYTPAELERVLEMHGIDLADLVEDDPDCELGKAESQEESRARA